MLPVDLFSSCCFFTSFLSHFSLLECFLFSTNKLIISNYQFTGISPIQTALSCKLFPFWIFTSASIVNNDKKLGWLLMVDHFYSCSWNLLLFLFKSKNLYVPFCLVGLHVAINHEDFTLKFEVIIKFKRESTLYSLLSDELTRVASSNLEWRGIPTFLGKGLQLWIIPHGWNLKHGKGVWNMQKERNHLKCRWTQLLETIYYSWWRIGLEFLCLSWQN